MAADANAALNFLKTGASVLLILYNLTESNNNLKSVLKGFLVQCECISLKMEAAASHVDKKFAEALQAYRKERSTHHFERLQLAYKSCLDSIHGSELSPLLEFYSKMYQVVEELFNEIKSIAGDVETNDTKASKKLQNLARSGKLDEKVKNHLETVNGLSSSFDTTFATVKSIIETTPAELLLSSVPIQARRFWWKSFKVNTSVAEFTFFEKYKEQPLPYLGDFDRNKEMMLASKLVENGTVDVVTFARVANNLGFPFAVNRDNDNEGETPTDTGMGERGGDEANENPSDSNSQMAGNGVNKNEDNLEDSKGSQKQAGVVEKTHQDLKVEAEKGQAFVVQAGVVQDVEDVARPGLPASEEEKKVVEEEDKAVVIIPVVKAGKKGCVSSRCWQKCNWSDCKVRLHKYWKLLVVMGIVVLVVVVLSLCLPSGCPPTESSTSVPTSSPTALLDCFQRVKSFCRNADNKEGARHINCTEGSRCSRKTCMERCIEWPLTEHPQSAVCYGVEWFPPTTPSPAQNEFATCEFQLERVVTGQNGGEVECHSLQDHCNKGLTPSPGEQ